MIDVVQTHYTWISTSGILQVNEILLVYDAFTGTQRYPQQSMCFWNYTCRGQPIFAFWYVMSILNRGQIITDYSDKWL